MSGLCNSSYKKGHMARSRPEGFLLRKSLFLSPLALASAGSFSLIADGPLLVELGPYDGGAALNHRAVYLDICLVATDGRNAVIAGSRLLTL